MVRPSSKIKHPSEKSRALPLPSERVDSELNRVAEEAKREARLREILNLTFKTPEGKEVLTYLMALCGYQTTSIVFNPQTQEINDKSMLWNEARRELYVRHIRKFLDKELLREIEIN